MKKMLAGLLVAALAGSSLVMAVPARTAVKAEAAKSGKLTWFTNLDQAKAEAQKTKRPIMLVFSGSDWCGFCQMLEKNVLKSKDFERFAEKNLVLVMADFPRRKTQSAQVKADAEQLRKLYPFNGFPSVYMLSADGKVLGQQSGYSPKMPAEKYIDILKGFMKK